VHLLESLLLLGTFYGTDVALEQALACARIIANYRVIESSVLAIIHSVYCRVNTRE